jgi:hypothetical protein
MAAAPDVTLLGIRHHGPGSARAVRAALCDLDPDVVLVEGPPEADAIAVLAGDPAMRPPAALLGYARDRPERAVFHPFAVFSPEWQALSWAAAHGREVRFIDLPLTHLLALDDPIDARGRPADPIRLLAEAAGYDDPERWWEDVVEHRDGSPFAAIHDAMTALREELERDGHGPTVLEARREAAMRRAVRRALRTGHARIAVICGAWHTPALARPVAERDDRALLAGLPKVPVACTWVPWTHRRLATASGYRAGVLAPGWYDHLFTHPGPDVVAVWFTRAARVLRDAGADTSPADVVEATRLAEGLATLRGRPSAGLHEVTDAARAALGGGTDAPMVLLADELVIGADLGTVPDHTPQVPLARDLAVQQRACRLRPQAIERVLELDLRRSLDLTRSRLLHRLRLIGVRWGRLEQGRRSAGTFRETWRLRWEPELAVELIDASAHGTTIEAAAAARLRQRAASAALPGLTDAVELALLADVRAVLPELLHALDGRAAVDHDLVHLMDALGPLGRAIRYGDVRGTDAGALQAVFDRLVTRVAAGLVAGCTGLDGDAAAAMADRLTALQATIGLAGQAPERSTWQVALAGLVEGARLPPAVQGRATRLLLDAEALTADLAGRRLWRALSPGTPAPDGGAFVEGFLAGSGTVLLHDPALLAILDDWVATLDGRGFVEALPLVRRTLATFPAGERRRLGERLRGGPPPEARALTAAELDPERAAAGLATLGELLGVVP